MVIGMSDGGQDREDIRAHLSMMQSVITRMADNSRACKTWAVTLVAAILVVVARFGGGSDDTTFGENTALLAFIPTILFWLLDAYYLAQERGFRKSYDRFVLRYNADPDEHGALFMIEPLGAGKLQTIRCMGRFATASLYVTMSALIVLFVLIAGWDSFRQPN